MRISVIIPCHDAAETLGATLRSVLNQTRPPEEIVVADDGSTDASATVAASFGGPVRVIRGHWGGASAARLAGLAEAGGDGLMFLDADDLIAPDTLASLAAVLADHPDAIAVCPWRRYEQVEGGAWIARPASCARRGPGQDDLAAWLTGWYHPPCSVLWSRAAYDRSGGWDPGIPVNNDGDVMMRGFVAGNRLVLSDTGTGFYRRLPGDRVSLSGTRTTRRGLDSKLRVLDRLADLLRVRGRLAMYAAPLREAYAAIARDAQGETADLGARALASAAALPEPRGKRPRSKLIRHRGAPDAVFLPRPAQPKAVGDAPLVSVVIPTYNRASTVRAAIDSVLSQTWRNLELLVVDDASTDDTAPMLAAFSDPRLRYLPQERNGGVARARNRGIAEARGRYVAFLDSDDTWMPEKLARQVALLEASPEYVGLVNTGTLNDHGDRTEIVEATARGFVFDGMLYANLLHGGASAVLVRASVFDAVGGFDPSLPAIEDYEFWIRVCRFYAVESVPAPLVRYFDAEGEVSGEVRRSRRRESNIHARQMLHDRYREDMRRAGTESGFLIGTVQRMAAGSLIGQAQAVRTLVGAIRRDPKQANLYALLPLLFLPTDIRARAVDRLRALRRAATSDRP